MHKLQYTLANPVKTLFCMYRFSLLGLMWLLAGSAAASPGGDFSLTRTDGSTFSLENLRGQVVVLSFGFKYSPDVFPTTVFISVDPRRDDPDDLRAYLDYFHESLIGLTGTEEQLQRVAERYGTFFRYRGDVTSGDYTVDHTGNIYVIDRRGQVARIVPAGMPPSQLVESVRDVLKEGVSQPASARDGNAG